MTRDTWAFDEGRKIMSRHETQPPQIASLHSFLASTEESGDRIIRYCDEILECLVGPVSEMNDKEAAVLKRPALDRLAGLDVKLARIQSSLQRISELLGVGPRNDCPPAWMNQSAVDIAGMADEAAKREDSLYTRGERMKGGR